MVFIIFYDHSGKLIYVGKSVNIKSRVLQHLSNNSTRRAIEMKQNIADVDYKLTGSELVALLLESDEIKKQKPVYNRAQRRAFFLITDCITMKMKPDFCVSKWPKQ